MRMKPKMMKMTKKMNMGGMPYSDGGMTKKMNMGGMAYSNGGMTKKMNMGGMSYSKGGMTKKMNGKPQSGSGASKRADGIASKGKTKGRFV